MSDNKEWIEKNFAAVNQFMKETRSAFDDQTEAHKALTRENAVLRQEIQILQSKYGMLMAKLYTGGATS